MKAKINEKLICIPPYISARWDQITFLQSEEDPTTKTFTLAIHLHDGKIVQVPDLDSALIDIAFAAHTKYLDTQQPSAQHAKEEEPKTIGGLLQQLTGLSPDQLSGMPIRFGISGMEGMPGMDALQHNQDLSDTPPMPAEVLEKISNMIKMMMNGDLNSFPKPEPHCNCTHCQVARTIHGMDTEQKNEETEELISQEDLTFRDWEINKTGENLYVLTNPLDSSEQYSVYLGTPVGCTCGQSHCEHIKAVLYS